jgi:hypothetical protein
MLVPHHLDEIRQTILYSVYFGSWLLLSVFFTWKKDNYFTNKYTLISGAVIGVFIPVANGFVTGNWLWLSMVRQQYDIFFVDMLWIFLSLAAAYAATRMKKEKTPMEEELSSHTIVRNIRPLKTALTSRDAILNSNHQHSS